MPQGIYLGLMFWASPIAIQALISTAAINISGFNLPCTRFLF